MKLHRTSIAFAFITLFSSSFYTPLQAAPDIHGTKFEKLMNAHLKRYSKTALGRGKTQDLVEHMEEIPFPCRMGVMVRFAPILAQKSLTSIGKASFWNPKNPLIVKYVDQFRQVLDNYTSYFFASELAKMLVDASRSAPVDENELGDVTLDPQIRQKNNETVEFFKKKSDQSETVLSEIFKELLDAHSDGGTANQ